MKIIKFIGAISLLVTHCCAVVPEPKSELGIRQRTEILPTPVIDDNSGNIIINKPGLYALTQSVNCDISIESDNVTLLGNGYTLFGSIAIQGNYCTVDMQDGWIVTQKVGQAILVGATNQAVSGICIKNGGIRCVNNNASGIVFAKNVAQDQCLYRSIKIQNITFALDQLCPFAIQITKATGVEISGCNVQVAASQTLAADNFFQGFNVMLCSNVLMHDCVIAGPMACQTIDLNCGVFGINFNYCKDVQVDNCTVDLLAAQSCLTGILFKDTHYGKITNSTVQNIGLKVTKTDTSTQFFAQGIHCLNSSNITVHHNYIQGLLINVQSTLQGRKFVCAGIGTLESSKLLIQANDVNDIKIEGLDGRLNPKSVLNGITMSTRRTADAFNALSVIDGNYVNNVHNVPINAIDNMSNQIYGISLANEQMNACSIISNRVFNTQFVTINNELQGSAYAYFCPKTNDSKNYFVTNLAVGTLAQNPVDYSEGTNADEKCRQFAPLTFNVKTQACG